MIQTNPLAATLNIGMGNTDDLVNNSKGDSRCLKNLDKGNYMIMGTKKFREVTVNNPDVTTKTDIAVNDRNKQPGVIDDTHIPLVKTKVGHVGKDCIDDPVSLNEGNVKKKVVHITS